MTDQHPTYRFKTFGCKVNQYESQALKEDLQRHGFRERTEEEEPDLVVVNTCTVTHKSDRSARKAIRRMHREHPDSRLVVVGCYAENSPEVIRDIEGVDEVIPHDDKYRTAALVSGDEKLENDTLERGNVEQTVEGADGRTRAWLKIEDGCNLFCNFCIIPWIRGKPQSKKPETVLKEIQDLADEGYKEVVLTGIHVGCYGADIEKDHILAELIRKIGEQHAVPRVRLSSIEADEVDEELLDAMKEAPNFLPHIHLPLQSGSDRILERMNRRYRREEYQNTVKKIRTYFDNPAITTDIIVGFPGETDEDFQKTVDFCREMKFSDMHIFSYSDREGTEAADMEPKVPSKVISKRVDQLKRLNNLLSYRFRESLMDQEVEVLVEGSREQDQGEYLSQGLTERYVRTWFESSNKLRNHITEVEVQDVQQNRTFGVIRNGESTKIRESH